MDPLSEMLERVCQISGALEGVRAEQTRQGALLERIESRMDGLESTVKTHSVVGGGLVAAVISMAIEYIKIGISRT
ncbi:MAG: hypothetical protein HQL90_11130 [Magnetococcales bacterium]|nr:hypothetical protein [Magnetococcales bacterium]